MAGRRRRIAWTLALALVAAVAVVLVATSRAIPPHADFVGGYPPPLAAEVAEAAEAAAAERGLRTSKWVAKDFQSTWITFFLVF